MDRVISELGVTIERFRADCGSFSKEIIQTVEQRCNTFYISAANCGTRYEEFRQQEEWKSVEVGYEFQCASEMGAHRKAERSKPLYQ